MTVLFALCLVTGSLAAVTDYLAINEAETFRNRRYPNADVASRTCGSRDFIGNVGSLLTIEFAGSNGLAAIIGQTRVSRTAALRNSPASFATITHRRCFMFRMFQSWSRCPARGPPQRDCTRPRAYMHSARAYRNIRNTKPVVNIPGRTGAGPHERTIQ